MHNVVNTCMLIWFVSGIPVGTIYIPNKDAGGITGCCTLQDSFVLTGFHGHSITACTILM